MDQFESGMRDFDISDDEEVDMSGSSASHQSILVVEDEALVGLGMTAMLETAGFEVIGPTDNVDHAMTLLDRHHCSLAILDIKLRDGETSARIAERLRENDIPFFVVSGYLSDSQPAIFNGAQSIAKPIGARSLVNAVQGALS